ncbi:MAG: hypothetical protein EBT13_18790 [Rhodobacteraceae bacterium]|nr:hypothetical protein [Paracoccaceae bacterium]
MSRIGKIARRTFLFGTVAIAGGVAFGVYKLKEEAPNPLTPGEGEVRVPLSVYQDLVTQASEKARPAPAAYALGRAAVQVTVKTFP